MMHAQWYLMLLSMKRWHRYAMTVLLLVCTVLMWLWVFQLPLHRQMLTAHMLLAQYKQNFDLSIKEQEACNLLSKQVSALEIESATHKGLSDGFFEKTIALLVQHAQASALHLVSIKRGLLKNKDWYASGSILLHARGTLPALQDFFSRIKKDQVFMQCCQVQLSHEQDGVYAMHCVLKLFMFHKKSAEKQSPSTLEKS